MGDTGEWKLKTTQISTDDRRLMDEVLASRSRDPHGPPATRAAVLRYGLALVHARECNGQDAD